MTTSAALMWFRRDLRAIDNTALFQALQAHSRVVCVFVLDHLILAPLPDDDRRLAFIHAALQELDHSLQQHGGGLHAVQGNPAVEIPRLAQQFACDAVYCNRDYEPYARARDAQVAARLAAQGIAFQPCKDQVIFECDELLTGQGRPYTVFTPYMKAWRQRFSPALTQPRPAPLAGALALPPAQLRLPALADIGFANATVADLRLPTGRSGAQQLLQDFGDRLSHYKATRDFPAIKGVSYLSAHLRFGTLSIREAIALALQEESEGATCWLNELIWREFYQQLLWHFPHVASDSFKEQYRGLVFPGKEEWYAAWCQGRTGYPIVDAAMRQLNHSGYMHNRLRMIAASFLVKDLLIDWRRGEAYFAAKLLDFDLAANNGGWQWAASTGCDAQPYFRIFNPVSQSEKFDPEGKFIRRYVPELASLDDKAIHAPWLAKSLPAGFELGRDYPAPIVEHAEQRELALALFGRK
ncbi:deoxyribodipyrimidine photo-lyase [Vogesella sp. LIG4]|uniref:cryptochrome/photolyase family protein n=1 Tax=Vogesella sp. LIG4 TaxID=1192162 RepID=UPI00081F9256|nr:deoxyribodipyrimidine photo-lyase [Vogesella sp. LIG4]SCK16690.1 deoxyribodipyrimidine photo-lyase [Vogesella sp. LIG4]